MFYYFVFVIFILLLIQDY